MRTLFFIIFSLTSYFGYAQVDSVTSNTEIDTALKSTYFSANQGSAESMFEEANQAFISGQYPLAAASYEAILNKGVHSSAVYYNLGNAYFEQNQIGKAILNYTRAYHLDPNDKDIAYNLEMSKSKTKDKIESVPQFFMVRWFSSIGDLLNSNNWAVCGLLFFLLTACGVLFWLISSKLSVRKLSFFTALVSMIFTVFSIGFSISSAQDEYYSNTAVVINSAAPIKSSPSSGGKDIFILHEGTVVTILQELDSYSEIELSDGNKGWIQTSAIETV